MKPHDLDAWLAKADRRPIVVGVLNVTPDSFSDGGIYQEKQALSRRIRQMIEEGADWIDIGGESTRPGSEPVSADEQIRRVLPAIEAAAGEVVVSIDTTSSRVASAALAAGVSVINDVSAFRQDPDMLGVMGGAKAVVLMHMHLHAAVMQEQPLVDHVVETVESFLLERVDAAAAAGVERSRVMVDPGIGFGKTMRGNLQLLAATRRLADLGQPLLVGASRKRFLGRLTDEPVPANRLLGTAATVAHSLLNGASAVRVHDVRAMRQVRDVIAAIQHPDRVDDDTLRRDP